MFEKVRLVNKMRIRMKRRKLSTRLFQMVIVTAVVTLFMYFLFQAGFSRSTPPLPDYSWLNTRNMSHFIRPSEETAIVAPPSCGNEEVELLVFVFSAARNFKARKVIRRTWAEKLKNSAKVKVFYILGRAKDSQTHTDIITESVDYNDILMEDFADTYLNLTLKTTFMLKWANKQCKQAKFIFKVDDDVFVNSEKLWEALESTHLYFKSIYTKDLNGVGRTQSTDYALIGHVLNTVPIRDPESKWYLPPKFYPLNIFPKFVSGTGYIFTGSLLGPLYFCGINTPFINLEDVFITGLCASTQLGLRLTHNPAFQMSPMVVGGTHTCNYKRSVLVHGSFQPEQIEQIYSKVQDNLLCDTLLFTFMTMISSFIDFLRNLFRF